MSIRTQVNVVNTTDGHRRLVGEFWTSAQRQSCAIHEISYRACFKPEVPRYFIERYSNEGDVVYDPFMGRGTTVLESVLLKRRAIGNDVNPLSVVLTEPRTSIPNEVDLEHRLSEIQLDGRKKADIDLSMFYHPRTEGEIVSLRRYLKSRRKKGREDSIDRWIRMVATNRLTGHSPGFFSVYTLPPNQAASPMEQKRINRKLRQRPEYRDVRRLIMRKSLRMLHGLTPEQRVLLTDAADRVMLLVGDARATGAIADGSVQLTVTSPPFLDVVQYAKDNWLRCWFNEIPIKDVSTRLSVAGSLEEWGRIMGQVFAELYRVTKRRGLVAFEVGEVRNRTIRLDEIVVPIGKSAGFHCEGVLINQQRFTKTSNIWGIHNNLRGTNSNRIVLFTK